MATKKYRFGALDRLGELAFVLLLMAIVGCQDAATDATQRDGAGTVASLLENQQDFLEPLDDLTGDEILARCVQRYSNATSYADEGVLYLNYSLMGRPIQEPHPFSTVWDDQHRWAARIFNSQVQCDGKRLSCYVFDIESANLDNQQLLIPAAGQVPVDDLLRDSIARHFVGGYADLPLDETQKAQPPKLIPPPIRLLTGRSGCGWVQQPQRTERLGDVEIDGRRCYVVRSLYGESTADIWIDQQSYLLTQISMPLKIMDRKVLTSGDIEDVEMLVRFHQASVNAPVDPSALQVKLHNEATPVRKFISIPDALPSEMIGEVAPKFELFRVDGTPVNRLVFDGKTTALLWMGGENSYQAAERLAKMSLPADKYHVGVVYSDMDLADPNSGSLKPNDRLELVMKSINLPFYCDPGMAAGSKLMIKAVPAFVVLDGDGKVQYAIALSGDDWQKDLVAALQRIDRGDEVAAEMHIEYRRQLDDYHQQLAAVDAMRLLDPADRPSGSQQSDQIAGRNTGSQLTANPANTSSGELVAREEWTCAEFQQAGNMIVDRSNGAPRIVAFDGWRTVVELDENGRVLARHELELPEKVAVNCIRQAMSNGPGSDIGGVRWAVFGMQGGQVFLFDQNWKLAGTVPNDPDQFGQGVRDVVFVEAEEGAAQDLVVAYSGKPGCVRYFLGLKGSDPQSKTLGVDPVLSLARGKAGVFYCREDGIGLLEADQEVAGSPPGVRFYSFYVDHERQQSFSCLIAMDKDQSWFAGRLNQSGKIAWRQPLGPMLLETVMEPVAMGLDGTGRPLMAIADADDRVYFFSGDGEYRGQHQSRSPLAGIALHQQSDGVRLLLSTERGVECWRLGR